MSFKTVVECEDSKIINDVTFPVVYNSEEILKNPTNWHKFFIRDVHGLKRNQVLKILFDYVKPLDFIPLNYVEEGKSAFFFVRQCGPIIEKLCNDKLTVKNPQDDNKPFKLKIILKYTTTDSVKVDLSDNMMKVLRKRFNTETGTLCLNRFSEDADLSEFFLLSEPRLLAFVLNLTRVFKVKTLKLCHNEIKNLDAMKIMHLKTITSIDLRYNLINDLAELKNLENLMSITELWLEGNPLCQIYDEYSYVQNVIKYCPKIQKLDGFLLRQNGVPSFRRNFLCNVSAYDVVDQFLERFFISYDSRNLIELESIYHEDALFSLTSEFFNKSITSAAQLKSYKPYCRNLLNFPGMNNSVNLCVGRFQILNLLNKLPYSEHDPRSFTVDVLFYSEKCVIIVVTGVFREIPSTDRMLGFNRCFVLECSDKSYSIKNEQLHVFNALTSQQVTAFKKSNALNEARNSLQERQMISTFALLTNLTKDWAKMFLEECRYNLKHAVILFIDVYKNDKIPPQGFRSESKE